jgi:hypothetical protein
VADRLGFAGCHRTATSGDEAGAVWLEQEAAGFGVEVGTEVFELDRLDPGACYLELDDERISAVPVFDAPAAGANGVTGTLSHSSRDEAIVVAELTPRSVYTGEYERLRRDTAQRALVIVSAGERPGMGLLNAERSATLTARRRSMCRARRAGPCSPVRHALHAPE